MPYFKILIVIVFFAGILKSEVQRIALTIGNNYGLYDEKPLSYAASDARKIHAVLTELGCIKSHRNYLLVNEKVEKIKEVFHEINGRIMELKTNSHQVFFYIYFSGHADPKALHIEGSKLSIDDIKGFFENIQSDIRIMIVDACYSGNLLREKGLKTGNKINVNINDELETKGSVILTSSSAEEFAHESEELNGSLFTHYWISGLRGAADYNKDRVVTLLEAFNYAQQNTLEKIRYTQNASQNPAFDIDLVGKKDIGLSYLDQANATIRFLGCDGEEYKIISLLRQEIVANVRPEKDDTLLIALSHDQYIIQRKSDKYLYVKKIDLTWNSDIEFSSRDMKIYPFETVTNKGKFNWQFQPFQILLRQKIRKDIPMNKTWIYSPQLSIRYSYHQYILNIGISYWHDEINGKFLDINRKSFDFCFGINYRIYQKYPLILDSGIGLGMIYTKQKPYRKDEYTLRQIGYDPLSEEIANIYQLDLQQNVSYILKYDIILNLQLDITSYFFNKKSSKTYEIRYPLVFGIGIKI